MTPELLRRIVKAYTSERAQTALADDLGINDRTMRRYIAGDRPMPDALAAKLPDILRQRRSDLFVRGMELDDVIDELKRGQTSALDQELP